MSLKVTIIMSHGTPLEQRFCLLPVALVLIGSLILYFKDDKTIYRAFTCFICIVMMIVAIAKIAGVF